MASFNYIGNPDFRGYLNYLGSTGDGQASTALHYVGNDGGINNGAFLQYVSGPGGAADDAAAQAAAKAYVANAYQTFQGFSAPSGGGSTGGTAGAAAIDPSIGQYFDQMQNGVNSQLGALDTQSQVGNQNIQDAYTTALNTLLGSKATTDRNYQTSKDQTLQDYVSSRGDIQAGVGQQANALQRLLGAHGSGSSSAAQVAAPYAAARQGSIQNSQVQNTFGRNQQALDTNYGDFVNQYNTSYGDLGHQKDVQGNQLKASIDQTKTSLLAQLAQIAQQRVQAQPGATYAQVVAATKPYQDQINSLGGQVAALGRQYAAPVIQAAPAVYKAPDLSAYNPTPQATPTLASAPGAQDNLSPFLSVLLNAQQKQKQPGQQSSLAVA